MLKFIKFCVKSRVNNNNNTGAPNNIVIGIYPNEVNIITYTL